MMNKQDTGDLQIKVSQCYNCKNQTIEENFEQMYKTVLPSQERCHSICTE